MKRSLLILLLLCTSAFAEQVLLVTLKTDGTTYRITDTELSSGYAPQVYSGGRYTFMKDGAPVASGNFPLPGEVISERFNPDGTIDGEIKRQIGTFTVALPAGVEADSISLTDAQSRSIGTAPVSLEAGELDLNELAEESDLFIRYEWLYLLLKWLVIIGATIFALRYAWRKLRTKK